MAARGIRIDPRPPTAIFSLNSFKILTIFLSTISSYVIYPLQIAFISFSGACAKNEESKDDRRGVLLKAGVCAACGGQDATKIVLLHCTFSGGSEAAAGQPA